MAESHTQESGSEPSVSSSRHPSTTRPANTAVRSSTCWRPPSHGRSKKATTRAVTSALASSSGGRRRGGERRTAARPLRRVYAGLRGLRVTGASDLRRLNDVPLARPKPALDVDDRLTGGGERALSGRGRRGTGRDVPDRRKPRDGLDTRSVHRGGARVELHRRFLGAGGRDRRVDGDRGVRRLACGRSDRRCTTRSGNYCRRGSPASSRRSARSGRSPSTRQILPILPPHLSTARRTPRSDWRASGRSECR